MVKKRRSETPGSFTLTKLLEFLYHLSGFVYYVYAMTHL